MSAKHAPAAFNSDDDDQYAGEAGVVIRDTRSQKLAAKATGLCPLAVAGKSFNVKQLEKYLQRRQEKRQREAARKREQEQLLRLESVTA